MKKNNDRATQKLSIKKSRIIVDTKYRAMLFTAISLSIGVCYAIFNAIMAMVSMSIWFGALAGYYMLLIVLRASVLMGHKKNLSQDIANALRSEISKFKVYRATGIVLLTVIVALAVAVAQMVDSKKTFEYAGLMIYAGAAYTFTKVIIAIVNFVKVKKRKDIVLEAIRNINIADAAVSILALQSAMFKAFAPSENNSLFNAITGAVVCMFILMLGAYMIIKSSKAIKKLR